jgi:metallophosphoesterase superfamily enzyme
MARVSVRGRSLSRKCFASNGRRVVMPAFGAFTGGLNVRNRAFTPIFGGVDFTAHMLGDTRLHALPGSACLPD